MRHRDWRAIEEEFTRRVIEERWNDPELAAFYNVTTMTIRNVRKLFDLPLNRKKRVVRRWVAAPVALPYTTYVEGGVTIKVYPACYAAGAIDLCTARPRR